MIAPGGGVVVHIDRITKKTNAHVPEFYDSGKMYEK